MSLNNEQSWLDAATDDLCGVLGLDPVAAAALAGENKYLLFVYGPQMVEKMFTDANDYTFQQYLSLACWEGLKAVITGNNPIGALMVIREAGVEYIFADHNRA